MNLFSYIRRAYHPIFYLRRLVAFRRLQDMIDFDVWIKSPLQRGGMCVKMLRDLSLILPHDGKEPVTRSLFGQLLNSQKPDIFFDVGANVGIYSWQAKNHGVPVVFLFEADMENQRLLAKTIKANHLPKVFLIPCAVSDHVGVVNFVVDNASGATGSLLDHY